MCIAYEICMQTTIFIISYEMKIYYRLNVYGWCFDVCLNVFVCMCLHSNVWICLDVFYMSQTIIILFFQYRPILHKIYWWNCHYSYTKPYTHGFFYWLHRFPFIEFILHLFMHLNCVCVCVLLRCVECFDAINQLDKDIWQQQQRQQHSNSSYRW